MELTTARQGDVAVITIAGIIDMRAAGDFERAVQAALADRAAHIVIDLQNVELLTSAAIRVLVSGSRRLVATGGSLVLSGINAGVRRVLEISGLTGQFRTTATTAEAIAALNAVPRAAARSKLAVTIGRLLGATMTPREPSEKRGLSALGLRVSELFERRDKERRP